MLSIFISYRFISKNSDLFQAKDSDACLKASGTNWAKYKCSSSTKWCTSWAKDMHRCCPESCGVSGSFSESDCKESGGKGSCIYPNEAQPEKTKCDSDEDEGDSVTIIDISLHFYYIDFSNIILIC